MMLGGPDFEIFLICRIFRGGKDLRNFQEGIDQ